jgi:hypothetical protein
MKQQFPLTIRRIDNDAPEVEAAERKVGAVLSELERQVGGEVTGIELSDVVETDAQGRAVVNKTVEIRVHRRRNKGWSR